MSDTSDFQSLIRAVRNGDAEAAEQLVKKYESELRIVARVKLNDPRLRRVFDSVDVCQSVLGNFFVQASAGKFDIESPEQLIALLATMIRNKVKDYGRKQSADRRNHGRLAADRVEDLPIIADQESPSRIVSTAELKKAADELFNSDEREINNRRCGGQGWDEIARDLGGSPEAIRKKHSRAVDRVERDLGLDAFDDE